MKETDLHHPPESCPFCSIASAYPAVEAPLWSSGTELERCVPEGGVDADRTNPASFVVLASRDVVAFLDILPMVGGEFVSFGVGSQLALSLSTYMHRHCGVLMWLLRELKYIETFGLAIWWPS
jgi:hypothetical protein